MVMSTELVASLLIRLLLLYCAIVSRYLRRISPAIEMENHFLFLPLCVKRTRSGTRQNLYSPVHRALNYHSQLSPFLTAFGMSDTALVPVNDSSNLIRSGVVRLKNESWIACRSRQRVALGVGRVSRQTRKSTLSSKMKLKSYRGYRRRC